MKKSVQEKSKPESVSSKNIPYGLISYILGLLSIFFSLFTDLGIAGIIMGVIGFSHSRKANDELARKGRLFSIIGIVIGLVILIVSIIAIVQLIKSGMYDLNLMR